MHSSCDYEHLIKKKKWFFGTFLHWNEYSHSSVFSVKRKKQFVIQDTRSGDFSYVSLLHVNTTALNNIFYWEEILSSLSSQTCIMSLASFHISSTTSSISSCYSYRCSSRMQKYLNSHLGTIYLQIFPNWPARNSICSRFCRNFEHQRGTVHGRLLKRPQGSTWTVLALASFEGQKRLPWPLGSSQRPRGRSGVGCCHLLLARAGGRASSCRNFELAGSSARQPFGVAATSSSAPPGQSLLGLH